MSSLFPSSSAPAPKVKISTGDLPGYVLPSQAPTKKQPWRAIREAGPVQSVTVALPDDLHYLIWAGSEKAVGQQKYAKVIVKLQDLLSGDFFTEYVKKGRLIQWC
jgi:ribonucleases P/MRP protein subunit RPP40